MENQKSTGKIRSFSTGATRDTEEGKYDLEGFLSPAVLNRYAEFMNKHRVQADGNLRDSDNWQKGIPIDTYMKSGYRHFFDWWANHRHVESAIKENIEESLCGLIFNAMGYLHEYLKDSAVEIDEPEPKFKAGDAVKIKVRHEISAFMQNLCEGANNQGTYVGKNGDGCNIRINSGSYWFFDDEVFPVEDN